MDRARVLGIVFALAVAAVPAGLALAMSGLESVRLADSALPWLPWAFAGALGLVAALATLALLVSALRTGVLTRLVDSGASAVLAGGTVVVLAGTGSLAAPVLASAALLAVGSFLSGRVLPRSPGRLIAAAVAVMAIVEAIALLTVIPATAERMAVLSQAMFVIAAVTALVAAVRTTGSRSVASALLGAASLALLADRGGTLEGLFGLAALTAAQLVALAGALASEPEEMGDGLPELAERLSDAVLGFDGHLRLRDWNAPAATLLGLDSASAGARIDDLLGVTLSDLPPTDGSTVSRGGVGGLEVAMHRSGTGVVAVVRDAGGMPEVERLGTELRTTIEELLRARRTVDLQRGELERSATVDPLTGVSSRAAILERLRIEVAQARRYRHPLAVVLLDVDRFGQINDAYGIAGGDAVLREVALRMRLRVREADALGRSGSDGFLATLPHTDDAGAATFADALRIRLGLRPVRIGDSELKVTVSVGVATMSPGEDLDVDGVLARVQEALDSARGAGGNRIALGKGHELGPAQSRNVRDGLGDSDAG